MKELIINEIINNFQNSKWNNTFGVHCSKAFYNSLITELTKGLGEPILVSGKESEGDIKNYVVSGLGQFYIIVDLEQGYKITMDV